MSLDNTSHLGGSGPDELVPSRYVLRVGDVDVLVISDGVLPLPPSTLATTPTRPTWRLGWTTRPKWPPHRHGPDPVSTKLWD